MEEELQESIQNMTEAADEMKSNNSLKDILNQKTKYAERVVVTYLDYDAAIRAFELQDLILQNENYLETISGMKHRSITDDEPEQLRKEQEELTQELADLNDTIQGSRAEWHVTGVPPKVWKLIDKEGRRKFPLAKEADDHTKTETQLDRNEYVNIETMRRGIKKIVFASGEEFTDVSHEDAKYFWDNLPTEVTQTVKSKIDELTFANKAFQEEIESADFLLNS